MDLDPMQEKITAMLDGDARYGWEAYQFAREALEYTQKRLGRRVQGQGPPTEEQHLSALELSEGLRDLAAERYGPLAGAVLRNLAIDNTSDIGEIVWNLVNCGLLLKSKKDRKEDFQELFDLQASLRNMELIHDGKDEYRSVLEVNDQ